MIDEETAAPLIKGTAVLYAEAGAGGARLLGDDAAKVSGWSIYTPYFGENDDLQCSSCVWFIASIPTFMQDAAPAVKMVGNKVVAFAKGAVAAGVGGSDAQGTSTGSTEHVPLHNRVIDNVKGIQKAQKKHKQLAGIADSIKQKTRAARQVAWGLHNYTAYKMLAGTAQEQMFAAHLRWQFGGATMIHEGDADQFIILTRYYHARSSFFQLVDDVGAMGTNGVHEFLEDRIAEADSGSRGGYMLSALGKLEALGE